MYNIGSALKRPFESKYNTYRRFLVSNGNLSISNLSAELRINYPEFFQSKARLDCMSVALHLNTNDSDASSPSILYRLSKSEEQEKIRNYPICAEMCFHSSLYQYTWVTQCPLHNVSLTTHCPTCHQQWPSYGQLANRKCNTCGRLLSWRHLVQVNAFDESSQIIEKMSEISEIIILLQNANKVTLVSSSENANNTGNLVFRENTDLFPSVIKSLYPHLSSHLIALGVDIKDITKLVIRKENIQALGNEVNRHQDLINVSEKVKKVVNKKIKKEVLKWTCKKLLKFKYNNSEGLYSCIRTQEELLETAYYLWLAFIDPNKESTPASAVLYLQSICNGPGCNLISAPPIVLNILKGESADLSSFNTNNSSYYILPEDVKEHIFEIRLIQAFLNILGYLIYLRDAIKHDLVWLEFSEQLPSRFHPNNWNLFNYILFPQNDNYLLLFESNQSKLNFKNIGLYSIE